MKTFRCTLCKKDLPETDFYPSFIKKHQYQWKKCSYDKYAKKSIKKYANSLKKIPEKEFDFFCGGYTIKIINHIKNGEYRYVITSTNKNNFKTNNKNEFINHINFILKDFKD